MIIVENESKSSFFGTLIGGKQKDALEKANQQLETITEELQAKIEEHGIFLNILLYSRKTSYLFLRF